MNQAAVERPPRAPEDESYSFDRRVAPPGAARGVSELRALDRIVLESLERAASALVLIFAGLLVSGLVGLTPTAPPVRVSTLVVGLVLLATTVAIRRGRVRTRFANPLAAGVAILLFLHLLLAAQVLALPLFENLYVLAIAALGFLILSPGWLAFAVAATAAAWMAAAARAGGAEDALAELPALAVAILGAAVFQWARLTTTRRLRTALTQAEYALVDLRATEEALRVKHEQYRSIFDSTVDGLTLRSLDRERLIAVNPAMAEMLGYTVDEFLALRPEEYIHADSLDGFSRMLEVVAAGERYPFAARTLHRSGAVVEIEGSFIPFGFGDERLALGMVKDVTERNANLERLTASEQRYRSLVEDQTELVVRWTPDGSCTFVNEAYCRYVGKSREDVLGSPFFDSGEEWAKVRDGLEQVSPQDPSFSSTQLLVGAGGESRWFQWTDRAIFSDGGEVVEIQSVGRDIHELVRAQERERTSDDRFRQLFENSPDAILVESLEGEVLDANPAACRLHGMACDELIGARLDSLIPRPTGKLAESEIEALAMGEGRRLGKRVLVANGREVPVSLTASRIEYGGRAALLIHARDVSEQLEAETALRESEQRYRRLFEQSRDAIIVTSSDRSVEQVNPEALELFECRSHDEFVQIAPQTYYERPEEREALLRQVAEDGYVEDFELHMASRKGRRFIALSTVSELRDPTGQLLGFHTILRDVTQQRKLEEQLLHAQKMEAVGRLAGGLAHDFNNMLTVIRGYADLGLSESRGPLSESLREIRAATRRATELTRQLLAFSRQQELSPEVVDLNGVVSRFERLLRTSLSEDVSLELQLAPELGQVEVDPAQVEQVLLNLVVNAGDAMPDGGRLVVETFNIDIDDTREGADGRMPAGPYVALVVSDNGCGMDEETRKRVFEPFFTTKPKDHGTGLGLSTAYGVIRQSGGYIWVYSEPNHGTVFKIFLPRVDALRPGARSRAS